MPPHRPAFAALMAAATLTAAGPARASERWLVSAGAGLTQAVSNPQQRVFGTGATGTASFYRSLVPWVALGTRVSAAVIGGSGLAPTDPSIAKPETGGLFTLTLGSRFRPFAATDERERSTGLWLEGAGGVARTGALWRPTLEAGLGYGISAGPVVVSPSLRFQQVIHYGDGLSDADGRFASAAIEVTFNDLFDATPEPPGAVRITFEPYDADHDDLADVEDLCPYHPEDFDGFRDEDGCPDHDVDRDGIADLSDACPDEAETINGINDYDGCPDSERLEVVNGVITIDEGILFNFDSYRIRPSGLTRLEELARFAREQSSWSGLVVEGHADVRGTHRYNKRLSLRRARAVQRALKRFGIEIPVEAVGFGEQRPLDLEHHARNRRVEIRVKEQRHELSIAPDGRAMRLLDSEDAL